MLWAFDLWNYEDVRAHADNILTRLEVDMPPESHGGVWPSEWVETFRRWVTEDFGRLERGEGEYSARQEGAKLVISASGEYPTDTHKGWFQRAEAGDSDSIPQFDFFFDSIEEGSQPGFPFNVAEEVDSPAVVSYVVVHDRTGLRDIAVEQV